MSAESLVNGATLRERFVAAATRDDESAAQQLASLCNGAASPNAQRDEAWAFLTAGGRWASRALASAGVPGTDDGPVRDSEAAFGRAQHLETKSWELSQVPGLHDAVALLIDAVRRACYAGADLGPIQGGRLAAIRAPGGKIPMVPQVAPQPVDLQDIGSNIGEALRRYANLEHASIVEEAQTLLERSAGDEAGSLR